MWKSRKLQISIISIFTGLLTSCNGLLYSQTSTPFSTYTPLAPTTGTIYGTILDKNRNPIVNIDNGDIGLIALICTNEDKLLECLSEEESNLDFTKLLSSICGPLQSFHCLLHWDKSATKINKDGTYIINKVIPGKYDLLLAIYSSGLVITIHMINVDPVEAGKYVRHDFNTK
jgi:hypothetical protein